MKKFNVLVGQSGGPTPVINASLLGLVEQALRKENIETIYGTAFGVEGILNGKLIKLNDKLPALRKAATQPGAILGTSRYPLAKEEYATIINHLEKRKINIFCYIGGNGSSRTVLALHRYAQSMGKEIHFVHIPKTIDNDLMGTDHCPGYGSAAKFLSHSIQLIARDITSLKMKPRVEMIEVMGGNKGWLPATSALFRHKESDFPDLVYLPEYPVDGDNFLSEVESALLDKQRSILVVIPDHLKVKNLPENSLIKNDSIRGNRAGVSFQLAQHIQINLGVEARVTVPNQLFRITPGLISRIDSVEAYCVGEKAIDFALLGYSGGMVSIDRVSSEPYLSTFKWTNLQDLAGLEKNFPQHYWDIENHVPTQDFIDYVYPLIDDERPNLVFQLEE
jgi:6-phosphofructokinase 1